MVKTKTKQAPVLKDNYGKPRQDYFDLIASMNEHALYEETKHKIWLSAYAANNPRSDYHWHVSGLYKEWVKREKVNQYERAYKSILNQTCGE